MSQRQFYIVARPIVTGKPIWWQK